MFFLFWDGTSDGVFGTGWVQFGRLVASGFRSQSNRSNAASTSSSRSASKLARANVSSIWKEVLIKEDGEPGGKLDSWHLLWVYRCAQQKVTLIEGRTEFEAKYFLFGNNGDDVFDGSIPAGTYSIRAIVNDGVSSLTTFTLGGKCGK